MLNPLITQTKISVMHQFKWSSRNYHLLKYYWKLYLKLFTNLTAKHPFWKKYLKDRLTETQIVFEGINTGTELAKVYYIAQSLAEAIRNNDHAQLIELLQTKNKNSLLHTLLKTFNATAKSIISAMHSPLSNGSIEGVIRKIKQINRATYGYRN